MTKPISFRTTLLVRFILAALLPVIFLGLFTYVFINRQMARELASKNQVIALATAGQISSRLTEPVTILNHIRILLNSATQSRGGTQAALDQALKSSRFFEAVYILDKTKAITHLALNHNRANREDLIGLDMSGLDLFQTAPGGEQRLSRIYLSPLSGRKSIDIALMLSGDRTLVGSFNIDHINDILKALGKTNALNFFISDPGGNLIFYPESGLDIRHINISNILPLKEAVSGSFGTHPFALGGVDYIGTTAAIQTLDWFIIVAQTLEESQKPLERVRQFFGILLVTALVIVAILALDTAGRLLRPLLRFQASMAALAGGRYKAELPTQPLLELEKMAVMFRKMATAIKSREESLKVTAEESRKNAEKFRVIFETANDGILVADLDAGKVVMANHRFARMLDLGREDLAGTDLQTIFPDPSQVDRLKRYREETSDGSTHLFQQTLNKPDGTPVITEVNAAHIEVGGADRFIGFFRDISPRVRAEEEKKILESQLRQAHKMEAIGTLAGGIAHDFNNLLGIILGNLELTMDDLPPQTPVRQNLEAIKTAGIRAKDVVRQLLSFSRKTEQKRMPVHLGPVISESVSLLRASIPSFIDLQFRMAPDLPPVNADPTQIQQVIINLCTNSAHAVQGTSGHIHLTLGQTRLDTTTFKGFGTLEAGTYVCLSVNDNGQGIPPGIIDRIFDPYFTTKDVGKGTGMGLAVVHGIVANHDGALSLYSEPGKGTEINLFFPAVEARPMVASQPDPEIPPGQGRILLVDDEPSLVGTLTKLLEKLGYTATPCTRSQEALDLVSRTPEAFDLVITDMTMPGLTGDLLAEKISRLRPDLPVIVCTGFSHSLNPSGSLPPGISMVLEKPVNRKTLAEALRKLLAG